MADFDCDYCNKTETCKYAWQESDCQQVIYDKVNAIPKEKQEEIKKFYYEILAIMKDNDLESEDFYNMTYTGLNNFIGYMKE